MQELLRAGRYFYCFILLLSKKWNRCFFNLSIISSTSGVHQGNAKYWKEMGEDRRDSNAPCKEGGFEHCHPRHSFLICNLTKAEENIYLLNHMCTYIPTELPHGFQGNVTFVIILQNKFRITRCSLLLEQVVGELQPPL